MLQALADLFAGPMHGDDGSEFAQVYFEMAALSGFERAALLFEPSLELRAGHIPEYNRRVA
jgi:hypothetical protein